MFQRILIALAIFCSGIQIGQAEEKRDYRLGGGDIIHVAVFQNPDFTSERRVSENGDITFPLVGTVKVGGLTVVQAEELIAQHLTDGGFVVKPQVSITPVQMRSAQVSVLGLVNKPGRYQLDTLNMTLSEVISLAGGVVQTAPSVGLTGSDQVVVKGLRDGKPYKHTVDLSAIFVQGQDSEDLKIEGGDVVYVSNAPQYYVYGEVQRPGVYRIEHGMTVRQALAQAGGLTVRGTESGARIYRKNDQGKEVEVSVELDLPLKDQDTLFFKQSIF